MWIRILLPITILSLGAILGYQLSREVEPPEPERSRKQRLQTEVRELKRLDYQVVLNSQGVLRAQHEVSLTASATGMIQRIDEKFENGAYFSKGDVLLELDPSDYAADVEQARAQLARAEAALAQEEALATQARLNWDDLGYDDEPSDLVLRIPQLKEARSNVDAAQAALDRAERDLARTKIRAPFDGRVRNRLVGLGQSIGESTPLGDIFASKIAEVRLPLASSQLDFIDLPSRPGDAPVEVTLTNALDDDADQAVIYTAQIVRTEGALDEASRELSAIARIDDPFGLESGKQPLRIGQPVRARIDARVLDDVFVIPRSALRAVNTIYLVSRDDSPKIERKKIEPVWQTNEELVVRAGLEDGQWLAVSRLPYAPNGAPVKILESNATDESHGDEGEKVSAMGSSDPKS